MSTEELTRTECRRAAARGVVRGSYGRRGKSEALATFRVRSLGDLAALYIPGESCLVKETLERPEALGELAWRDSAVAVVINGSALLGRGRAVARAALRVMGGKASMVKRIAGIDAIPFALRGTTPIGSLPSCRPGSIHLARIGRKTSRRPKRC